MTASHHGSVRLGFALLGLSIFANATAFHTNAAALRHAPPLMVAILSCFLTVGWMLTAGCLWRRLGWRTAQLHTVAIRGIAQLVRQHMPWVLGPPLCVAIAAWLLNYCVTSFGAAICAFLMNLTLVLLVLGGLAIGERLGRRETLAITLTIAGAFLYSYDGGQLRWAAIGLMTLFCLATAGKQLLIKRMAQQESLPLVMTAMMLLSGTYLVMLATLRDAWRPLPLPAIGLTALTALLGSALGMCCLYYAYSVIGVAHGAPIDAMRPVAVLLIALLLGATLPKPVQLAGAALILLGSAALAFFRANCASSSSTCPTPQCLSATGHSR